MHTPQPTLDDLVDRVQHAYPAIWFACHTAHRTRGAPHDSGLTDREATILAHIPSAGIDPAELTVHLGMAKSSLSAHLSRLESLGLIVADAVPGDKRRKRLSLTAEGRRVKRNASPLATERVAALLRNLEEADRAQAVAGLCLLAEAAQRTRSQSTDAHPGVHVVEDTAP
jgi:DNA-binding MarR family transcriptional regulator